MLLDTSYHFNEQVPGDLILTRSQEVICYLVVRVFWKKKKISVVHVKNKQSDFLDILYFSAFLPSLLCA